MSLASSRALTIARPTVRALMVVNLLYALSISILLGHSFFVTDWPDAVTVKIFPNAANGLRVLIVIGVLCAGIVHTVLRRLVAIIDSVRAGDPFTFENAKRLQIIAWSALALEVLRISAIETLKTVYTPPYKVAFAPWAFGAWLAIVLLFVLAGVFAQGARMRADLEGTV